ncbi:hypothetical protein [Salinispora arenicola]|uniref:hypothetical protein n=1 Tax=Salinispora arenicola TaxID=168697 RepID=UPI00037F34D4|nr:hypothetical protein [Salinispora arenicola]
MRDRQEPDSASSTVLRHRRHHQAGHGRKAKYLVSYDDDEKGDIVAAAGRVGLTPTGYIATAALAAARGTLPPVVSPLREVMAEVNQLRTSVARFGTNVNQAVMVLHSTGEAPPELAQAVRLCTRVTLRVDELVAQMRRRLG